MDAFQVSLMGEGSDNGEVKKDTMTPFKRQSRSRSRVSYLTRFRGRVVAVVTKFYIKLTPEAVDALSSSHVKIYVDRDRWGFRSASDADPDAYPLKDDREVKAGAKKGQSLGGIVYCADFIQAQKMPNGFYFDGEISHDYAVNFSKTPTGKV